MALPQRYAQPLGIQPPQTQLRFGTSGALARRGREFRNRPQIDPWMQRRRSDIELSRTPGYGVGFGYRAFDPFNPLGQIERGFGAGARGFYESGGYDPGIFEAISRRGQAESGGRQRAALLGLQARGGDIPGGYGTAALLSQLGSQSDLSRELGEADLQQRLGAQQFKRGQLSDFLDYLRQLEKGERGFEQEIELERQRGGQQRKTLKSQRRGALGGVIGGLGGTALGALPFARGGVVDEPTRAILGEEEEEAVLPASHPGFQLLRRLGMLPSGRGAPELPVPYRSPREVRPEGFLERLGVGLAGTPEVGPEAGFLANLLSSAGRSAGGALSRPLLERKETRKRSQDLVDLLNALQSKRYGTELDIYQESQKPRAPSPLSLKTVMRGGKPVYVPEAEAIGMEAPPPAPFIYGQPPTPPTPAQISAGNFADRAIEADVTAQNLENQGVRASRLTGNLLGMVPLEALQGDPERQYWQAVRQFVEAHLRRESGAAITNTELETAAKAYFGQPGDSDALIQQKRAARRQIISGLGRSAGPGLPGRIAPATPRASQGRPPLESFERPY